MRGFFTQRRFSRRRARQAQQTTDPGLLNFLSTPVPEQKTPLRDVPCLAIDIETSGLDPKNSALLSVGFVPVCNGVIDLSEARSFVVADTRELSSESASSRVGQSAVVHHLTDDDLSAGIAVSDVLEEVFAALTGRIIVAHFAQIETSFLRTLANHTWGIAPDLVAIDTMELQARIVAPGFDDEPNRDALRLWSARSYFGLPEVEAHNALGDALACAELFLAQTSELARQRGIHPLTLRHVLT